MSSASIQKLFCGIYSVFKCSFDEFVGEKVFSPSYSSAILAASWDLKSWLKTHHSENKDNGICSHHIMANTWGNNVNSERLYFGGLKITADGDWSYEIEGHLLLGRKVMTKLDSILKSRDITLPTKVHVVKAMVFPLVMYRCENWTIKKPEWWRIDAFELCCWRRLLRILWTACRSNQSI